MVPKKNGSVTITVVMLQQFDSFITDKGNNPSQEPLCNFFKGGFLLLQSIIELGNPFNLKATLILFFKKITQSMFFCVMNFCKFHPLLACVFLLWVGKQAWDSCMFLGIFSPTVLLYYAHFFILQACLEGLHRDENMG